MDMSTHPELEEFLKDALDNASILNRYVFDASNCLIYQKACLLLKLVDGMDLFFPNLGVQAEQKFLAITCASKVFEESRRNRSIQSSI